MARGWWAVAVAVLSAGCAGSGLAPVRGQLVYPDGQPAKELVGCSVVFEATGADGKPIGAIGEVDAEGRFELTTTKPGDGAPVGTNRVALNARWPGKAERPEPLPVPEKYANVATSGLTVEVKPGPNDVTITVEPKPGKPRN